MSVLHRILPTLSVSLTIMLVGCGGGTEAEANPATPEALEVQAVELETWRELCVSELRVMGRFSGTTEGERAPSALLTAPSC